MVAWRTLCRLGATFTFSAAMVRALACTSDRTNEPFPTVDGAVDGTAGTEDAAAANECAAIRGAPPDDASVQAGFAFVDALHCQSCHGGSLRGNTDGFMQPFGGNAYPSNLTPDPATGLGCWSSEQIVRAILEGVDKDGHPLCAPMPQFGDAGLDPTSALLVVAYLRGIPPVNHQVPPTGACSLPPDAGDAADASDGGADGSR
jgi:hypothetical protein